MNVREFSEVLEKNGVCSSAEFLNACNSDNYDEEFTFLKEITNKSERYYKLEGYLFLILIISIKMKKLRM